MSRGPVGETSKVNPESAQDGPYELPEGWVWTQIKEVLQSVQQFNPRATPQKIGHGWKEMAHETVQQATAGVFLTAFKALSRQEQEVILSRVAEDRKLRRLLEDITGHLAIKEERGEPSRPLREYIKDRERKEQERVRPRR